MHFFINPITGFRVAPLSVLIGLVLMSWSNWLFPAHAIGQEARQLTVELAKARYSVAYNTIKISSVNASGQQMVLDAAVWYPTSERPTAYSYDLGGRKLGALVAPGGQVAPGAFPLVIYSHGATGGGLSSVFLTQRLASRGYVVVAPDHTDDYSAARISPEKLTRQTALYKLGMLRYLNQLRTVRLNSKAKHYRPRMSYRPLQVRATLDFMLNESQLRESVDHQKIGLVGHSLGAWTSFLVGGADPKYADARIDAIVALSPPVNMNVFSDSELANVQVPMLIMYGTTEVEQGRGDDRTVFFDRMNQNPVFLLGIERADHFTFAGGVRSEYKTVAGYLARDPRRAKIARYADLFLDCFLKNDERACEFLRSPAPLFVHKNAR